MLTSAFGPPAVHGGEMPAPAVTFANPILKAPAQDPQVMLHEGRFYYCESSAAGIFLRVADDFLTLGQAPRICVWAAPKSGPMARNVWAPELHIIDGRCYIYFAADDGENANHRMWVLAAATDDPLGHYELAGPLDTGGWAIDGTVHTNDRGERFFIWSGWPGKVDGQQNLYISRMQSPVALTGPRVLLTEPDQPWERRGMPICEGPQILRRGGKTFVVYSASASWTEHYCLGMLVNDGGDLMNPLTWHKTGVVFSQNEHAWGLGHCGFITTADGREDWILYHAKTLRSAGWNDREVRTQPFRWDDRGHPVFGAPVSPDIRLPRPGTQAEIIAMPAAQPATPVALPASA